MTGFILMVPLNTSGKAASQKFQTETPPNCAMTNPMTKFAITAHGKSNRILLALLMMTGAASAQSRTFYDFARECRRPVFDRQPRLDHGLRCARQGDQPRVYQRPHDDGV